VADDPVAPLERFESWLLQRVAQAVEAGEVSADLLTELRDAITEAQDRPQDEGSGRAVQDIAARLGIPVGQAAQSIESLERLPTATREAILRRVAEAWLAEQAKQYRGGEDA
jgi:hypothetical protein